jgi:hypothetical protein
MRMRSFLILKHGFEGAEEQISWYLLEVGGVYCKR